VKTTLPLLLLLLSCTTTTPTSMSSSSSQPAPAPAAAQPPQFAPSGRAQRVVLLSFDGLGADMLAAQPDLQAFAAMRAGTVARVVPINPTLTGPTHMSILTGVGADKHGIVSNRFHMPGAPPKQAAVGMETDPDHETIVEHARRSGRRVGCVVFPSLDGDTPRRSCDFGLAWTTDLARSRTIKLARRDFHREWVPPTWTPRSQRRESFSPIMRSRIEWSVKDRVRADVDIIAYDTTNDRVENYDAFAIEVDDRELPIEESGWFSVSRQAVDGVYGSWGKLIHADPALASMTIYWGGIHRNDAYPADYRALLEQQVGVWPGEPDRDAPPQIFLEQSNRLSDFLTRAQTLSIARMQWDLLLIYQPQIDEALHQFLGSEPEVIRGAWVAADRALAAIRAALDPSRDALVVTGDHGLAAIDTELRVNRLLLDAGFGPRWQAFASGGVVHFYRFEGSDDADALVNLLTASGHFELVEKKTAAMHRNAGDVVAYAKTNIALSSSSDTPAVRPASYRGQHGGLNTHRELHTMLFAIGAGVRAGDVGEISQTAIADYVAKLLGI
jgi:hypothetical protein